MEKENILGIDVCVTSYEGLKRDIYNNIINKSKSFIVAINPEKVLKSRKDSNLMHLLNNASHQIPDGIGIVYASKLKKGRVTSRITGIDSCLMLCELSREHNFKIFIYGAKEHVIQKAKQNLEYKFPGINIVGTINGYEKDEKLIIEQVNNSGADIIFVAMGSPKQENWIVENMQKTCPVVFQGIGGSLDVFSGSVKRAPDWMQKAGLEWLYRLIIDPKRITRQIKLVGFFWLVLINK